MPNENSSPTKKIRKVYYGFYPHCKKPHPVINLKGLYLSRMNFEIGDSIDVVMEPGLITIRKIQ